MRSTTPLYRLYSRFRDKVPLALSEASTTSKSVEDEITKVFAKEHQSCGVVLFPVRLYDAVFDTRELSAAKLCDSRDIGDLWNWNDHDAYQVALKHAWPELRVAAQCNRFNGPRGSRPDRRLWVESGQSGFGRQSS